MDDLYDFLKTDRRFGLYNDFEYIREVARRLRVPTGLSDAEILERAADIISAMNPTSYARITLRMSAKVLRSEQNTQKPTKEKDAND